MMLLWLLMACGVSQEDPDVSLDTGISEEDEYIVPEGESTVLLTVEEVGHGIEAGLQTLRLLDPAHVQNHYLPLVQGGDEACPEWKDTYYEDEGYNYWKDACTAKDDTTFSGWAKQQRPMDYQDGNHHYMDDGYLEGEFEIQSPDGLRMEFSGKVSYWERIINLYRDPEDDDHDRDYYVYASGDVTLYSNLEESTWLEKSLVYNYDIYFRSYDDDEGMLAAWEGGVFGLDGDSPAIFATDFYIYSEAKGSACELEPSGLISVRDTLGQWYDVQFHGPSYVGAWSYQPKCDGCGDVWFRGEYLGQSCVDFSIFTGWNGEGRPW
jgi:hypothetical protein